MMKHSSKILSRLQNIFRSKTLNNIRVHTPLVSYREFHQRRNDPFAQMEGFMRDMERKFWGEVNQNFPWFPRLGIPSKASSEVSSTYPKGIWGPSNLSTSERFKLAFNFPQAKPEDIKVSLKDHLLTIEAKVEESDETTKMNQSLSFQYTLPESVDVEFLESVLTHDGVLTIEAPKTPDEAPKTINIKREE